MSANKLTYKDAGVDIDAGNALVERIKPLVARTQRPEVLAGLGGFGGLFAIPPGRYCEPVLVSGTDGVGTKLKLAQALNRHGSIGIDLVAMCANDVLVQGAEPLFYLDYFACGKLDVEVASAVIGGIAAGCELAGAALIGGETAEMPDMYAAGEYDLAGFCVGIAERSALIDGSAIAPGNVILGLGSSGPHSNGYSLIRKVLDLTATAADVQLGNQSIMDALLAPTRIYVKSILALLPVLPVLGMAHITGGGLSENIPRVLPENVHAVIAADSWTSPEIFAWLANHGNIATDEMYRTFNCGIGMVVIVNETDAGKAAKFLGDRRENVYRIGHVAAGAGGVQFQ